MNIDTAVLPGSRHLCVAEPCEDYAQAGLQGTSAWAVVSDGCSSGLRTDLGARAWTLAASEILKAKHETLLTEEALRESLLATYPLYSRGLDAYDGLATLVVSQTDGKQLATTFFGDGCLVIRHFDEGITLVEVHYESNAPCYLQYLREPAQIEGYRAFYGSRERVLTRARIAPTGELETLSVARDKDLERGLQLCLGIDELNIELALVTTDGLTSRKAGTYATALELSSLKNRAGSFLSRRLAKLYRSWQKEDDAPDDDLAAAGIWLAPEVSNG